MQTTALIGVANAQALHSKKASIKAVLMNMLLAASITTAPSLSITWLNKQKMLWLIAVLLLKECKIVTCMRDISISMHCSASKKRDFPLKEVFLAPAAGNTGSSSLSASCLQPYASSQVPELGGPIAWLGAAEQVAPGVPSRHLHLPSEPPSRAAWLACSAAWCNCRTRHLWHEASVRQTMKPESDPSAHLNPNPSLGYSNNDSGHH